MMPANLFRFLLTRPPQKLSEEDAALQSVRTHPTSEAQTEFLQILLRFHRAAPPSREGMQGASKNYINPKSKDYIDQVHALGSALKSVDSWHLQNPGATLADIAIALDELLPGTVDAFVQREDFRTDRRRIGDSLLAHHMLGSTAQIPAHLARLLRLCRVLECLVDDTQKQAETERLSTALDAIILLPDALYPLPKVEDAAVAERKAVFDRQSGAEKKYRAEIEGRAKDLAETEAALADVLAASEAARAEEAAVSPGIRPVSERPLSGGQTPERPDEPRIVTSVIPKKLGRSLPVKTKRVLENLKIDLDAILVTEASARLESEINGLSRAFYADGPQSRYMMIGSTLAWGENYVSDAGVFELPDKTASCPLPGSCKSGSPDAPSTSEEIPPGPGDPGAMRLSYGELMVVEQKLRRYELGEIAHVENVLQGEKKERTHRRSQTTEEIVVLETEVTEEIERDLQTTERFELQSESERVQSEDVSREAGLNVSGKYGPTVKFEANAKYGRDTSVEESQRTATNYSREVTERAVSKIQERVFERRTRKVVVEVEETNLHSLSNTGSDHIAGVYRWLNKIYESQVVNYGQRAMVELTIPEPAAFLSYAKAVQKRAEIDLVKPERPGFCRPGSRVFQALLPQHLCASNYMYWVAKYGVTGIEPPPRQMRIVGKSFDRSNVRGNVDTISDGTISVPEGYLAQRAWVVDGRASATGEDAKKSIDVYVGRRFLTDLPGKNNAALSNEDSDLPVSILVVNFQSYVINIEVECRVSPQAQAAWQLATFNAIQLAYVDALAEYEERLGAQSFDEDINIGGSTPQQIERIMRDELKRSALSIVTGQQFDAFGAMRGNVGPLGYPEMDMQRAAQEGPYVRFFEQAFEWEHMSFVFYPYYWSRKETWPSKMLLEDGDPMFAEFLRAGSARVVVPIRPRFETVLGSFLTHGWLLMDDADTGIPGESGDGELPLLDLVAEIKAKQGYDGTPGIGTVSPVQNSADLTGTGTIFDQSRDAGREIHIDGVKYRITSAASATQIILDRPYEGVDMQDASYALGPKNVGEAWEVTVPTLLVYLENGATSLPTFS